MAVLYARPSWRLVGQITADVFVLIWTIACGMLAVLIHSVVAATATPAREASTALRRVSEDFAAAAERAAAVPGVGSQLRRPFDDAVLRLDGLVSTADHQAVMIERAAVVLGWSAFVLPVLIVLVAWLPGRIAFVRRATAAQRFLDAQADLDLFALRALANQPMHLLARISDDPVSAWRTGDRLVIDALAQLELRRSGLRLPPGSPTSGSLERDH